MQKNIIFSLLFLFSLNVYCQEDESVNVKSFTLLVKDYDEAIKFYCDKLGFEVIADFKYEETKRWVSLGFPNSQVQVILGVTLKENDYLIGNQTGEYPIMVLKSKDINNLFNLYT